MITRAKLHTAIGDLIIREVPDADYPGFTIGIRRPDGLFEAVWVEVNNEDKRLQVHLYDTDPDHDEPCFDMYTEQNNIDKYLKG